MVGNDRDLDASNGRNPSDFQIQRFRIELTSGTVTSEAATCEDLEDVFGGIARGFKLLEDFAVDDAYDSDAALILNLGILSGTDFMTGLRTYFHAYSPLKTSLSGKPSAMWSAGSGKFGTKLRFLDIDEIIFTGRCETPTLLHIHRTEADGSAVFTFEDASDLVGLRVNERIQNLHKRFPDAHFSVIGPAGDQYQHVRFAAIALSTENQFKSGDPKARWCGRGGLGGVMGSKNLLAIVADTPDRKGAKGPPEMKEINKEIARGDGSARFRDKKKGGSGGTWANYEALNPIHAMPEMNFNPTGTAISVPLYRDNFEQGPYVVKAESCYRCGISCHKNVYDKDENGKPGKFKAKLDFEPLNLLSSNLGIFDSDQACELVELVDEMGMDSISCGVTLSYAMEYNRRHQEALIANGLSYGDFEATRDAIIGMGNGDEELGQGCSRLSRQLGEIDYAMHCKGVEFPAYLPQTNPGYPWALAGGHMSMKTYLLLLYERETGLDYWVDAITNRGPSILRDDFLGTCKFTGLDDDQMVEAVHVLTGLQLNVTDLRRTITRTFLRGYRLERRQGFTDDDYVMPGSVHSEFPQIELPFFNTQEFFGELKQHVINRLEEMLQEEGLA
jgi:aldehyde:ferredoxin oxidoreductase